MGDFTFTKDELSVCYSLGNNWATWYRSFYTVCLHLKQKFPLSVQQLPLVFSLVENDTRNSKGKREFFCIGPSLTRGFSTTDRETKYHHTNLYLLTITFRCWLNYFFFDYTVSLLFKSFLYLLYHSVVDLTFVWKVSLLIKPFHYELNHFTIG